MFTKAIIEQVIDDFSYKVRIPVYNRAQYAVSSTPTSQLPIAHVCCPPGYFPSYSVGDIVYVTFEDNNTNKPVIIGQLFCKKSFNSTLSSLKLNNLEITSSANLPKNTFIGEIKGYEIQSLKDISNNIQYQIDILNNGGQ